MQHYIYYRDLDADDASLIHRLSCKIYPREFHEDLASFRNDLKEADQYHHNLSIGMFKDDTLIGYIIAYFVNANSVQIKDDEKLGNEDVIYINDYAILTKYRRNAHRIFDKFLNECRNRFSHSKIYVHAINGIISSIIYNHRNTIKKYGYSLIDDNNATTEEKLKLHKWAPSGPKLARQKPLSAGPYVIAGTEYNIEIIRDEDDWRELKPVWDSLLSDVAEQTVFQTFDYQYLWWRFFGMTQELFIVLIKQGEDVKGIAPLMIGPNEILGKYFRELGFIGSRWEVDRPAFIFPESSDACLIATLKCLQEKASRWDICNLYEQIPGSRNLQLIQKSMVEQGYLVATTPDSICPYLTFDTSWEVLLNTKSRKFRQNLKASRRKLQSLGTLDYSCTEQWPELDDCFDQYKVLEGKSWKQAKKVGINRDVSYSSFYYALANKFAENKNFTFRILTLDKNPIAATFGLIHNNQFYSLHIVYDPAFRKYSPGTLLESMELEECIKRGVREYDFLGGFLNNKLRWTKQYRETTELFVYRKDPRLRLVFFIYFVAKPGIKQFLERTGVKQPLINCIEKLKKRFIK